MKEVVKTFCVLSFTAITFAFSISLLRLRWGLFQRCRLGLLFELFRVVHYGRRLNRVVRLQLVLVPVANIDACEFSLCVKCELSWPLEGSDDNDTEVDFVLAVGSEVVLLVAHEFDHPRLLRLVLRNRNLFIKLNALQAGIVWIFSFYLLFEFFGVEVFGSVFWHFGLSVDSRACF